MDDLMIDISIVYSECDFFWDSSHDAGFSVADRLSAVDSMMVFFIHETWWGIFWRRVEVLTLPTYLPTYLPTLVILASIISGVGVVLK